MSTQVPCLKFNFLYITKNNNENIYINHNVSNHLLDNYDIIRNLEPNCQNSSSSYSSEIVACKDFIHTKIFPY